jgi:hypothetical protein
MNKKTIVGPVLFDFSADFDVIDNELLLKKLPYYGFTFTCHYMVGELFIQ